jgi:hypothetical protein
MIGTAQADEPPLGFYLGGSVGKATVELEDEESSYDFKGDDTSFKVFGGYRILPWVAVEVAHADYGKADDELFGVPLRTDISATSIEGVGLLPIGRWDLFLKAGVAYWDGSLASVDFPEIREDENNWDATFGFGGQFRHGQLAIRAEANLLILGFDDDDDDEVDGDDWVNAAWLGASWAF